MIQRALPSLSLITLLATCASAQAPKPAFDIADVHVSPRATWVKKPANNLRGGVLNGDRYELSRATMLDLVRAAYNVDADKVYGGPSWLDYDRYEMVAKAPPGTKAETLRLMLQSLLADRFKLVIKADTKPMPAYVLTAPKGQSKLKHSDSSGASGCSQQIVMQGEPSYKVECRSVTMDAFVEELRRLASGRLNNLPVSNSTGLEGAWDIDLEYSAAVTRINSAAGTATELTGNVSVADAIDKQLGLTLKLGTAPQSVLSVESVNQAPSANPPGVAAALPTLPEPQFEVASLRLCNGTGGASINIRFEAAGRVTAQCMPIMSLVRDAWGLSGQPAGVPKALADGTTTKTNISITAQPPAGNFTGGVGGQDRDALYAMLRSLLIERYQMKIHYEDRPVDAYTLTAGKPKLTKADPANRTGCTRQPNGGDMRLVCQNMTLAQFAEQLPGYDAGLLYPVQDATGVEGAWDFTLNYNLIAMILSHVPLPAPAATQSAAPDPTRGLTLTEAIERQLGLKLVSGKRNERVFVIDHMEDAPAEN